jgi:hypothetical protein
MLQKGMIKLCGFYTVRPINGQLSFCYVQVGGIWKVASMGQNCEAVEVLHGWPCFLLFAIVFK